MRNRRSARGEIMHELAAAAAFLLLIAVLLGGFSISDALDASVVRAIGR